MAVAKDPVCVLNPSIVFDEDSSCRRYSAKKSRRKILPYAWDYASVSSIARRGPGNNSTYYDPPGYAQGYSGNPEASEKGQSDRRSGFQFQDVSANSVTDDCGWRRDK